MKRFFPAVALLLAACAQGPAPAQTPVSAQALVSAPETPVIGPASFSPRALVEALRPYCGQAFEGRIAANQPAVANDPFEGQRLVMHVRVCEPNETRVALHVGEDRSRTWVLTILADGRLQLKHDHRHADGSEDVLTQYGGASAPVRDPTRVEFPADDFSKALFEREGIPVSAQNTWAMSISPGDAFIYELARPGRLFQIRFDLTRAVPAPPAPWGAD